MPTDVTASRLEVVTSAGEATGVAAHLLEVVVAANVDSTMVHGHMLEVVVAPEPGEQAVTAHLLEVVVAADPPSVGPGGPGGSCPTVPAGVRLWWALDVELGGVAFHFGTQAGEVAGEVYRSGLAPLALSRLSDPAGAVALEVSSSDDWPEILRTARWLADGGPARLYLVVEGDGATRRTLWADGRADAVRWGLRGQPLSLQLRPAVQVGQLPPEQWVVDDTTRPAQVADDPALDVLTEATSYEAYPDSIGLHYNVILGYPGYVEGGDPYPCVPAPVVQWATYLVDTASPEDDPGDPPSRPETVPEAFVHVLAGSAIEATTVYALDRGIYKVRTVAAPGGGDDVQLEVYQTSATPTGTLEVGPDLIGQATTWLYQLYNHQTQGGTPELWFGLSPEGGGGVLHHGRLVRGAADVFVWLIETTTSLRLDRGRQAAAAPHLNRYLVDTWLNEPVSSLEWFRSEVLPLLPAAVVRGEDGVYLAHLPLRATRTDAVIALEQGRNAEFVSLSTTGAAEVVNHLTYSWGPTRDGAWVYRYTLTREYRLAQQFASAYYGDPRMLPHALCKLSHNEYGPRPGRIDLSVVWDAGTAHRIAEDEVIRRAFPSRALVYSLRPEHHWVEPGMVATLTDDRLGLNGRLVVVVDVLLRVTGPEVTLRPVRSLSDYL